MKKIIMIDDDQDDQIFYERLFKEQDVELIFEAYSSIETFLQSGLSDDDNACLIILDLNMPKVNGKDFLNTINVDRGFRGCPVIILTTSSSPLDMLDCQKYGVHSYFVKPMNYEDCLELVASIYSYWFKHNSLMIQS